MVGIFKRRSRDATPQQAAPDEATAHPLGFAGEGPYAKSLGDDCGVVFEDDGTSGYFYATNGDNSEVLDALWVYDRSNDQALQPGVEAFIVWNPARRRVGLFYDERFQAVFDFVAKQGVCRAGLPPTSSSDWSPSGHAWDDSFTEGIEP